jgi:hypothetical protein
MQCGSELLDNSKFCSNCGYNLAAAVIEKKDARNLNKIIKQDEFHNGYWVTNGNKGVLTLYPDRLEWNGQSRFKIDINNIINVITDSFTMKIKTETQEYKFRKAVEQQGMALFAGMIAGPLATAALINQQKRDLYLDSWRQAIETAKEEL